MSEYQDLTGFQKARDFPFVLSVKGRLRRGGKREDSIYSFTDADMNVRQVFKSASQSKVFEDEF